MKAITSDRSRARRIAAAAVFLVLAGTLILSAFTLQPISDEAFYYTIPLRLLQGDRMLADEWHLSQFSSVFLLLPYRIYTAAAGGTEGVLLFMRLLYSAVMLTLFVFYCRTMRGHGVAAIFGAALFCADAFVGIPALNYYNLFAHFLTVFCLTLPLAGQRRSPAAMIAEGLLLACAVLCQPGFAAVWLICGVFVLIRRIGNERGKELFSNSAFPLDGKTWLRLSIGAVAAGAAFCAYLFFTVGIRGIFENLAGLFGDRAHGMTLLGNAGLMQKLSDFIGHYGALRIALSAFSLVAAALYSRFGSKKKSVRAALFLLALTALIAGTITKVDANAFLYGAAPLLPFALSCYFLCEKRDVRLSSLLLCAVAGGLVTDYFSDVTILYGARMACLPAACFAGELLRELLREDGERSGAKQTARIKKRSPLFVGLCILAAAALLCVSGRIALQAESGALSLADGAEVLRQGPYRGLSVCEADAENYGHTLADLDRLTDGYDGPFYVGAMQPEDYLYLDLPIGTFTTYYINANASERQALYWQLHPEKRPGRIYIPYEDQEVSENDDIRLVFLRSLCSCEITRGVQGYLIFISEWY